MRRITPLLFVAMASLAIGCAKKSDDTKKEESTAAAKPAEETAPEKPADENAPADEAEAAAADGEEPAEAVEKVDLSGDQTIASLNEALTANKAGVLGQEVTVTGAYLNTNTTKSGDSERHNIVIVPEKGQTEPSIGCHLAEGAAKPEGLTQGDAVKVKGKVDQLFGDAALMSCELLK